MSSAFLLKLITPTKARDTKKRAVRGIAALEVKLIDRDALLSLGARA
jgi:hypothetical protein